MIGINPINKITGINILFAFNVFLFPFVFKIIFSLCFIAYNHTPNFIFFQSFRHVDFIFLVINR